MTQQKHGLFRQLNTEVLGTYRYECEKSKGI